MHYNDNVDILRVDHLQKNRCVFANQASPNLCSLEARCSYNLHHTQLPREASTYI